MTKIKDIRDETLERLDQIFDQAMSEQNITSGKEKALLLEVAFRAAKAKAEVLGVMFS